jgi:hypothetical protein
MTKENNLAKKPKGDDLTESYKKPPEKINPPTPKPPPAPPQNQKY